MTDQTDPAALVKALVWNWITDYGIVCYAKTSIGTYTIHQDEDSCAGALLMYLHLTEDGDCTKYAVEWREYCEPEDLQAAAQADYEARILSALTVIDAKALVKAALKAAMKLANVVEYADRPAWANTGSWCHAVELYGMRIRALADDPEEVAGIIEQVKGESDE